MDFILKIFLEQYLQILRIFAHILFLLHENKKTNEIPNGKHDIFPSSIISFLFALR